MIKAKEKSGNNSSLLETRKRKLIEKFDSLGGEGINFSFLDLDKATFSSILSDFEKSVDLTEQILNSYITG